MDVVACKQEEHLNARMRTETEENVVLLRRRRMTALCSDSDLVALDVSVLRVHRRRVPRHVQLGGCRRLDGHILRRGCRHCREATTHTIHTLIHNHIFMHFKTLTSELQPRQSVAWQKITSISSLSESFLKLLKSRICRFSLSFISK